MRRGIALSKLIVAILLAAWFPARAEAHPVALAPLTCVGEAASAGEAFALSQGDLDCGDGRFAQRGPFVRTHSDLSRAILPPAEMLLWQTDPSAFDAMLLRFTYADGTARLIDVDPQMAVRNWHVGARFSVPVPSATAPLVAVDMVVERPRTRATAGEGTLVPAGEAAREQYSWSLVYALVCGLMLIPILYDILFYRVLRERFMLWHVAMAAAILVFTLSNTGLLFELVPGMALLGRWHLNTASLAIAFACAVMFARRLLEPGVVPRMLDRLLLASLLVMLLLKLVSLFNIEALRMRLVAPFLGSMIPVALLILAISVIAWRRGSRAARHVLIAFSGMIAVGALRLTHGFGLGPSLGTLDDALLAALVVMALGTSAGVGDRFMTIRLDRDIARRRARRLGRLALTDSLTGLANRRAFDKIGQLDEGRGLLVADIDHFKRINDTLGHQMGDAVLCHAAQILREALADRPRAQLFRLGGEEFAVIDHCAGEEELTRLAETVRLAMEARSANPGRNQPEVRISVGGVCGSGQGIGQAFAAADRAMYRAKDMGRNRIAIAGVD